MSTFLSLNFDCCTGLLPPTCNSFLRVKNNGMITLTSAEQFAAIIIQHFTKCMHAVIFCISVAELKQLVEKPEVVEAWDVTAQDPRLLVHLKGALLHP
jgi:hypothetical protein